MDQKPIQKGPTLFTCVECDYTTCKKSKWEIHKLTRKHQIRQNPIFADPKKSTLELYSCLCGKKYKHKRTLWDHKKSCKVDDKKKEENVILSNGSVSTCMIMELLKQNNELQKQLIELSKEKNTFIQQNTNTNCNNKNKFNLNFFLNETCKNAMNIMDFANSLQVQLTDLETTGKVGFVDGISKIIVKGLNELEIDKRPLHCSDLKREVLYVKDENKWEKENKERTTIKKVIKQVANKNIKQLPNWIEKNPHYNDYYNAQNDQYLHLINNAIAGSTNEENENKYNQIIHNISKEIVIDK